MSPTPYGHLRYLLRSLPPFLPSSLPLLPSLPDSFLSSVVWIHVCLVRRVHGRLVSLYFRGTVMSGKVCVWTGTIFLRTKYFRTSLDSCRILEGPFILHGEVRGQKVTL